MQTIAYLGPPGTFSEEAAAAYANSFETASLLPLASIPAVVTAIETAAASIGVLPIENLLEGSVNYTLDLLIHETSLPIVGEIVIPIRQYLVARHALSLSEIEVLYAHPQSLGQCRRFIERCLPNVATVASLSNSAAPAEAMADPRRAAAISTLRAAEITGANILARDIADNLSNVTRFIALAQGEASPSGDDKTSFCFAFREDRAGTLVEALRALAEEGINMTKLESRPAKESLGKYIFLVDINGHCSETHIARALERIAAQSGLFKIFGSYPRWVNNGN
ncbi:prephenate dehydratase [Candidatus Viridilinea mediisalina]|uniref:Prephenate dehydratase n=1 Tax=Candidatus Viridilinea mediisalina TaxID=2024553 RepID=A0A2A6RHN2_9CHLR|nr:prephenate dehydratase [Candidatus Viridilinea mediisalina]PDW02587.1 prephenate dehydratase [Candidatus Viridilinea mediisalina]